ncbi:hydroxyglutarate oxidase [Devosia epidermidihirudinis]|uniref:Hydroxyglutarate oxidase n=1 Tax=Devosia epidermidihirudinis TaxID=1293439 RepID=A0A0F5Q5N5_9HYPH|nr:L-2-hydroxyglutarate oxidase [Devosia epidermidihirudinis]KKC35956.1 hydroxyglutarate oxidase [Devosia epidermidihirudinis]
MLYDYCIIGGGILGLATARDILRRTPDASVILIEKETMLACHQTGHNSGVIHAGVYYKPGSLKARLCKAGAEATRQYCTEHGIAFETRGKLIVATDAMELARMDKLAQTATENGIAFTTLSEAALREREPNISGLGALFVRDSGIVDYRQICVAMGTEIEKAGGTILLGHAVTQLRETADRVDIVAGQTRITARYVIACAGLQSDRLARQAGLDIDHQIIPFRGEYYDVSPEKRDIVHHMIYPVPDPALPFLGIHLTPTIHGELTLGPNAVLGLAREGYPKRSFDFDDALALATFPGFWNVAKNQWRSGLDEFANSIFKRRYLKACQKYCPGLELSDLVERPAGIRAQAVARDGTMAQDFLFNQSPRTLHVGNAPSPAATSAIPIAEMIVSKALESMAAR